MKRIIIVGASSGIGRELALQYAAGGALVGITGRRAGLLEEIREKYPHNVLTSCFDVMEPGAEGHFQQLVGALQGLDIMIYNAGFGEPSEELDLDTELATTETNALGCVKLSALAFNYFLQQGKGRIAITSSVAALRGNSWTPAYSASKAFVSNYAEGLNIKAKKLKKDIVITDIRPGFVDTKMAKGNHRFWVSTPQKAAGQILEAIDKQKRVTYITRRWWLVAQLMKVLPFGVYSRLG